MMRYKVLLSYMGTHYSGWQKQPGAKTIQQTLEEAFSTILRERIEMVGCGRTDTGVHAKEYTAHFDTSAEIKDAAKALYQANAILPPDIAIWNVVPVHKDFHARYDALERSYQYAIHFVKDPFLHHRSFYLNRHEELDQEKMKEAAALLLEYQHFMPFCKTGSDNKNYQCSLKKSEWDFQEQSCAYSISANRFLRGMVRMITGACLNVGFGRLSVEALRDSMISQKLLPLQWSVPPYGLYFEHAIYPDVNLAGGGDKD